MFGVVFVIALIFASLISVPFEAITPGSTVNVSGLITVPKGDNSRRSGSVSLVDVNLVPLRAINYLFFRMNSDNQIVPTGAILGSNSQSTYDEQGVLDMASAQQAATFVAFRELGYPIQARPNGVAIYDLEPNSPASLGATGSSLAVGDIIRRVDSVAVQDVTTLRSVLAQRKPGDRVVIAVQYFGQSKQHSIDLRLGVTSTDRSGNAICVPDAASTANSHHSGAACLGVVLMPMYRFVDQPFVVNLSAEGIIGPSAGLAFTLGLIEKLDPLSLTDGLSIAATGTISLTGAIGDVGGVAQKTIAVRKSGARVFFVPISELATAESKAGPHLRVFAVNSISQVIMDLEHLGGRIFKRVAR